MTIMTSPSTTFRVAPPATKVETVNYTTIYRCGACKQQLHHGPATDSDDRLRLCLSCKLDYADLKHPDYINPAEFACMASADDAKESSRVGWCYLPASHQLLNTDDEHYFLTETDVNPSQEQE